MSRSHHRIGLIGAGIDGSLSPTLHQTEASALGLSDYSYELLDIDVLDRSPEDAAGVLRDALANGYTGFNVTHPCKQTVMAGLDEITEHAAAIGAVNTVVLRQGRTVGHNTDETGFHTALRTGLPGAAMGTVVLCGAGGAGAAVGYALVRAGARQLLIADTDVDRATALADRLGRSGVAVGGIAPTDLPGVLPDADGVVNASPIGMDGHPGTPFATDLLHPHLWVADVVYRPVRTELLAAAQSAGCRTLDGAQMLIAQAVDSFALVTGIDPDPARMRRHLAEVLDRRAGAAR